jgi:hypothetical protein
MNILSTTKARDMLPALIAKVKETGKVFVLGRRNLPEAILMRYPIEYAVNASDIANINAYSRSFDFLNDEPEVYTLKNKKCNESIITIHKTLNTPSNSSRATFKLLRVPWATVKSLVNSP